MRDEIAAHELIIRERGAAGLVAVPRNVARPGRPGRGFSRRINILRSKDPSFLRTSLSDIKFKNEIQKRNSQTKFTNAGRRPAVQRRGRLGSTGNLACAASSY